MFHVSTIADYWDKNVSNLPIAAHLEVGTAPFFQEVERHRYTMLDYLETAVPFDGLKGQTVLDLGCGLGTDAARFASAGADVTGVDVAPRAVTLARKNFRWRGLNGRFEPMDGEELALPDDTFDFVFCYNTLQFTRDPSAMIKEVYRVLKPGGRAIVMSINRKSWLYVMHRWFGPRLDHMDAPAFHKMSADEFRTVLDPFSVSEFQFYRDPVRTEVHKGWRAALYNTIFVRVFHLLPKHWTRRAGYHMLAYVKKPTNGSAGDAR